jgi:4-hydroxybenzoate polyprenyltransferase
VRFSFSNVESPRAEASAKEASAKEASAKEASAKEVGWGAALRHDPLPIGAIAAAVVLGGSALMGVPADAALVGLSACGAALVYWADRVLGLSPEDRVNHPGRVAWIARHRGWLSMEALALLVGAIACAALVRPQTLVAAAGLAVVGGLHVLPLLPGRRRMKAFATWKRGSIAAAWALGGVLLPVVEAGMPVAEVATPVVLAALGRFGIVLANVRLADAADRPGDRLHGLAGAGPPMKDVRRQAAAMAWGACALFVVLGATREAPVALALVEAVGAAVMALAVRSTRPRRFRTHLLVLDVLVAWPLITCALHATVYVWP